MKKETKQEWFLDRYCGQQFAALLENGTLAEFSCETEPRIACVGNIYKGKVINVVSGMNAAFIQCGLTRNCYLSLDDSYTDYTKYDGTMSLTNEEKTELKAGDEFSVYFSMQTNDGYAHVMVDTSYSDSKFIYTADNSNAKSYFTYAYGVPGYSLNLAEDYDWCLRIKAYTEKEEEAGLPGDIDGDSKLNLSDIFALKGQLLGDRPITAASDLNGDGKVNIADIFYLRKLLLG